MIDGRRVWLVGGQVPYARLPRCVWKDRIHAAKHAGLNTIETPIYWNRHEPRAGKFDFAGENDLRHFVELVGNAGLYCILGFGPYIGDGWDMGGLPAWLASHPTMKLRSNSAPFLEACSRFYTAAVDQVRSLQVTSAGSGGPIILAQCESNWTCGLDSAAESYLGELVRYLREAGLNVPVVNSNNLWNQVEGQLDGWSGTEDMLATMRQLAGVREGQPRIVIDFDLAQPEIWGRETPAPIAPEQVLRRLAEVLVGGGQFNIRPFCGGTTPGFFGGRSSEAPDAFHATGADQGAIIKADGAPGEAHTLVRRIAHFASRFGRVFSNLDPVYQPVALEPGSHVRSGGKGRAGLQSGVSVVHAAGSQGSVAFVYSPWEGEPRQLSLVLADGDTLPVWVGRQGLTWCLFDVLLNGRSQLDYCNASVFANVGELLVVFAPAGSTAILCINGSPVSINVPAGDKPEIVAHENSIIVVVNDDTIDRTFITDDGVLVGVAGLTTEGAPIPIPGQRSHHRIGLDGRMRSVNLDAGKPASTPKLALSAWQMASCDDYADGSSPRYAAIDAPADLATLGCPYGYGWYRLTLKADSTKKVPAIFPYAADRLHLFLDAKDLGVVGAGPGASEGVSFSFKKGMHQLVILADNLGRLSAGTGMGEKKGLYGEILEAAKAKVGKPKFTTCTPMDILGFVTPAWDVREGDTTSSRCVTWTVSPRRKGPLIIELGEPPAPGVLWFNDQPKVIFDTGGPSRIILPQDSFKRGPNVVQIAFVAEYADEKHLAQIAKQARFMEGVASITAKAETAFAKWETPGATSFGPLRAGSTPAWYRATFPAGAEGPLYVELNGLSKGQIYVNGRHICRFFTATATGKNVPPQSRCLIPASALRKGEANELMIFDEHGKAPGKVRLSCAMHTPA